MYAYLGQDETCDDAIMTVMEPLSEYAYALEVHAFQGTNGLDYSFGCMNANLQLPPSSYVSVLPTSTGSNLLPMQSNDEPKEPKESCAAPLAVAGASTITVALSTAAGLRQQCQGYSDGITHLEEPLEDRAALAVVLTSTGTGITLWGEHRRATASVLAHTGAAVSPTGPETMHALVVAHSGATTQTMPLDPAVGTPPLTTTHPAILHSIDPDLDNSMPRVIKCAALDAHEEAARKSSRFQGYVQPLAAWGLDTSRAMCCNHTPCLGCYTNRGQAAVSFGSGRDHTHAYPRPGQYASPALIAGLSATTP